MSIAPSEISGRPIGNCIWRSLWAEYERGRAALFWAPSGANTWLKKIFDETNPFALPLDIELSVEDAIREWLSD